MVTNRLVTSLMGSTSDESKLRFRLRLYTLLSFIAALVLCAAFAVLSWKALLLSGQKTAAVIAANQSSVLEERLSRSLSSTYALASVLRQGHGEIDNFETLATDMLHLYGGISSLQLARRGVISAIVPLAGNEKAMGHDVLNDPARSKEAQLALRSRSLTLAGPFTLLQGGVAVTGRLPVFLPNAMGEEEFWGFTTALIRIPSLLETSTLPQLINDGYHYELSHVDPDTGQRKIFAQSNTERLQDPVVHTIEVPNGKWFLSIAPTQGWAPPYLPLLMGVAALLIALLVAFFTHTTLKQPLLLRRQVALRTGELAQSNRELSLEIAERENAQAAVARLNRLYSALSHTNGAIVRITEKNALLQEICHIAVEYGGFPLAKIAMLDQTGPQREWIAKCGLDVALPDCNQEASCASRDAAALNGQALRVCSSIKEDSAIWHPVCSQALDAGFSSHVVLPLNMHGQVAGLFSLYAYEPNCFDEAQLQLLKEMSTDLSFALTNIEHEALHRKGEENLRKLSRAVEQSANAVLITNRAGVIEYINPWFTKITGYSAEEIVGKTPSILKSHKTHPETHRRLWDTLLSGREWTGELHNTKKNGELYWCMETISPLKNEAGEVTHFVAITEDISERKQNEETIRHLAFHDALTGLPNRRLFRDRLYQAAAVAERNGEPFALMLLDLDRFKTVNDTLGHDIGDELLKAVSERLTGNTRKGDTLARMGGDEFAMIAIGISQPEPMVALTQNLLEVLKAPFQLRGHQLYVTTSIGITLYPGDTAEVDALIKNADIALYRAKDQGRNGYQFFTGDMNAAMLHRLHLDNSMRWAIERGEFMLHYQPQIDILSGAIHGTEALIRWQHPEFGLVSPAQFIPLAEETGMIVPISEWVLRTACAQGKAWERAGNPMRIAVNLSARQFRQADLAEQIAGFLKDAELSPSLLEVELTEGTLMEDSAQTTAILDKLHQMGVQISIDDFGTGYSSLSYLKRLPIQLLKIDQSFVRDIGTDPDDRAIVTAVIALAHSLKMRVVAEGVETREQLAFLREQGCDEIQGYLYSRPVPGTVLLDLLQADTRLLF